VRLFAVPDDFGYHQRPALPVCSAAIGGDGGDPVVLGKVRGVETLYRFLTL
jgi:hypothetical protein